MSVLVQGQKWMPNGIWAQLNLSEGEILIAHEILILCNESLIDNVYTKKKI